MLPVIPFLAANQLSEVCCSLRLLATVRPVSMPKTFLGAVSGFLSDDVHVASRSVRAECRSWNVSCSKDHIAVVSPA